MHKETKLYNTYTHLYNPDISMNMHKETCMHIYKLKCQKIRDSSIIDGFIRPHPRNGLHV